MKGYTMPLRHFDQIALLFNPRDRTCFSIMRHTNKKEALC